MASETQKPGKGRKFLIVITLLIVLVVFAGVAGLQRFIASKKAEAAANMPETVSTITAMTVSAQEWTPTLSAVGYIRPNQGAMLSAEASGTVSKVLVQAGQNVKKGDLLVEFDSAVEVANLRATQAQLPNAKANYDRFRALVTSDSASKAELDNAKATYDQLVASAEALKETIARRKIYAPFDGIAGIVNVNVGQYINAGTEIVRVEDQSSMKVRFTLPQTDVEKIEVGQAIDIEIDALPDHKFSGTISAIDPAVDHNTGLINLEGVITDNGHKLLSGMFARVNVSLPTEKEQIVVPQIVVTYTMYGETVYVLQPLSDEDKALVAKMAEQNKSLDANKMYRAKQIEVKTLDRNGNFAQLSKGLKAGDLIVTGGFQRLNNNALVIVSDQEAVGLTPPTKDSKL